ncbi:MAG: hypothetical protein R6V32_06420 [Bacteroidales bacterium]
MKNITSTGYHIFSQHNMVIIVYQGKITNKDILECIEAQYANKTLSSIPNRLIDFRNASIDLKNNSADIANEVQRIRHKLNVCQPENSKEAILVSQPGETAYFYLYLENSRKHKKVVKCFSTLEAALHFLEIELTTEEKASITENLKSIHD